MEPARLAVIGVDVLAEQRDLARALAASWRASASIVAPAANTRRRAYRAPRRRCRTCRSLPAPSGRPSRRARPRAPAGGRTCSRPGNRCRARRRPAGARRRVRMAACARLGDQLGQPVIGLRADHQVDGGLAAHDLLALGLGDAAGDGDGEVAALGAALELECRAGGRARNRPSRRPSRGCGRCSAPPGPPARACRSGHSPAAAAHRPCGRSHRRSSGSRRC